jgi:hypothetical protein
MRSLDASTAHSAEVIDLSKEGLGIVSSSAMEPGTLIEVDLGGSLIFGEVKYSAQVGPTRFRIGMKVEHALWVTEASFVGASQNE